MSDDSFQNHAVGNQIIYNSDGYAVGVILDGEVHRLQTANKIESWFGSTAPTVGQKSMEDSIPVTMASDQSPQSIVVTIAGGADVFSDFLVDSGGSEDMVVDGSSTPVTFSFEADGYEDIRLSELRVVISANSFVMDGVSFAAGPGLTNGILIELTVNDGTNIILSTTKLNEDFLRFVSTTGINLFTETGGTKDVLVAAFSFGGQVKLVGGSSDEVKITVRDDLTTAPRQVNYMTATFYGFTEGE